MGLLLQGGSANVADIQFEGGSGNKTVTIPQEGGKLAVTDSPVFTGTPTAPTPTAQDNSTKVATTAYVDNKMVRGTAVTASGTSIDFTGIPSWVKRITVMLDSVSTSGTSIPIIQLGTTTFTTSGYLSGGSYISAGVGSLNATNGLLVGNNLNASHLRHGIAMLVNISGNIWVMSATLGLSNIAETGVSSGKIALTGTLARLRLTTVNGTDTFDAGSINIMYEG